jgi:Ca2+/Na+ antiporter
MNLFNMLKRASLLWAIVFGVAVVSGIITLIATRQNDNERLFRRSVFLLIYTVFFISNLIK